MVGEGSAAFQYALFQKQAQTLANPTTNPVVQTTINKATSDAKIAAYNSIGTSGGVATGGFRGAVGFSGAPATTGGSGMAPSAADGPSLGDFAVLPVFAIGAVILLFWLKRKG